MDRIIKCVTNDDRKVPIVRVWLKMNGKEFNEKHHSIAGSHSWTSIEYEISLGDLMDLIDYLNMAELKLKDADVIV